MYRLIQAMLNLKLVGRDYQQPRVVARCFLVPQALLTFVSLRSLRPLAVSGHYKFCVFVALCEEAESK